MGAHFVGLHFADLHPGLGIHQAHALIALVHHQQKVSRLHVLARVRAGLSLADSEKKVEEHDRTDHVPRHGFVTWGGRNPRGNSVSATGRFEEVGVCRSAKWWPRRESNTRPSV